MASLTKQLLEQLQVLASAKLPENRAFFGRLRKKKPKNLDEVFHRTHEGVFEVIDCLECANCCKSISPIIIDKDIERLAKGLRMKPSQFVEEYLELDKDHDYVFRSQPCPFLMPDNYCTVYEDRPRACREYPHTDRKRMYQALSVTLKNTNYCPAVYEIVERVKKEI